MSYNEFQLTEAEVDRIKAKNARKAIRAYIKQHGSEPSDISSYYTATNAELEHYRRVIYAEQMTSGDGDGGGGETHDYSRDYLTFEAIENTTFTFSQNALQYSLDDGTTWTTLAANTASPTVTAGNKIMWKQTGLTPDRSNGMGTFSATGNFKVSGNIMSLYYGDNFIDQTVLTGKNNAFYMLFYNNIKLVDASNLILPATTLATYCYQGMFYGCTSLTTAPELPAITLADYCYAGMFQDCTSLTSAPELPATTVKMSCYAGMFQGCTSLTLAPELPATTVKMSCYQSMFKGCTSLTSAPELPAETLINYCYASMFEDSTSLNSITCLAINIAAMECTTMWVYGVASSGTFTKAASMTDWTTGITGIPNGWTVQDAA